MGGGTAVAQDRTFTTGKYGSHPSAFVAQAGVAHGVHAAVDSMEAAGLNPHVNGTGGESGEA
jgi:hypothetical protein